MDIVFVCGARDFHAMDKFRSTSKYIHPRKVHLLTDLIESEEQKRLINEQDSVFHLYNIDWLLFNKQSRLGNLWRNIVKMLVLPIQVNKLKKFYQKHPNFIYHAIPMYYMVVCRLAKVPFVATPQGSEILVRPQKSNIYKKNAIKALQAAKNVIVDSVNMQNKVRELSNVEAVVLKNGFDTTEILKLPQVPEKSYTVLSIRAIKDLYRIDEIIKARDRSQRLPAISFLYPSREEEYQKGIKAMQLEKDIDLGRLDKPLLYKTLKSTLLAVSIPKSDSSPRSVYEAIFAGACVAVTYSRYIEELPSCMRDRIFMVNLEEQDWLDKAIGFALEKCKSPYIPSEAALEMCDQERTINKIINEVYNPDLWN